MDVEDIWTAVDDRIGHLPGAWDCPCGPWVLTDMDIPPTGLRTVRHVALDVPRGQTQ
jgi:hypothetical protein